MLAVVLAVYLVTLSILVVVRPRWLLFVFVGTKLTVDLAWNVPIAMGLSALQWSGLLFPFWMMAYLWKHPARLLNHPLLKFVAALILINLVAAAWGVLNSTFRWFELVASPISLLHAAEWNLRFLDIALALIVLPALSGNPGDFRRLCLCIVASAIVPLSVALWQLVGIGYERILMEPAESYRVGLFPRIDGGYQGAGTLAIGIFAAIVAGLYAVSIRDALRPWLLLFVGLACIAMYFTFSRTLWITTTMFAMLWFYLSGRKRMAVAAVIVPLLILLAVPLTSKRFERELDFLSDPASSLGSSHEVGKLGTGRVWTWRDAIDHYSRLDIVSKMIGSGGAYGSHNIWLHWLLRNGLLGIVLYALFLVTVISTAIRRWREKPDDFASFNLAMVVSVVLVGNMFMELWHHWTFAMLFWLVIGLTYKKEELA